MLHNTGTDYRVCSPRETLEKIKPLIHKWNLQNDEFVNDGVFIHRIYENNNLLKRNNGIPSQSWGKGTTQEQSLVSGYMEFIERYCFAQKEINPETDVWSLQGFKYDDIDVLKLTTYGLVSGNEFHEAVLHGLYEWIEQYHVRDYIFRKRCPQLNGKSFYDKFFKCLKLVDIVDNVELRYFPTPFNEVANTILACGIQGENCHVGVGTHADPQTAMTRARCEVYQSHGVKSLIALPQEEKDRFAVQNTFNGDIEETVYKLMSLLSEVCHKDVVIINYNLPDIPVEVYKLAIVHFLKTPRSKGLFCIDPTQNYLNT